MRLLLIEEDARRCAHIRERLISWRPHAELVVHCPVAQGALARDFLAQGFDVVMLADEWPGGRGLTWARELSGRAGFAPIVPHLETVGVCALLLSCGSSTCCPGLVASS